MHVYALFHIFHFTFSFKAVLNQFEIYFGGVIMYYGLSGHAFLTTSKFGLSDGITDILDFTPFAVHF